jgi:hypothetical protein
MLACWLPVMPTTHLHCTQRLSQLVIAGQRPPPPLAAAAAAGRSAVAAAHRFRSCAAAIAAAAHATATTAAAAIPCGSFSHCSSWGLCRLGPSWVQQLVTQRAQHNVWPLGHEEDVSLQDRQAGGRQAIRWRDNYQLHCWEDPPSVLVPQYAAVLVKLDGKASLAGAADWQRTSPSALPMGCPWRRMSPLPLFHSPATVLKQEKQMHIEHT